MGAVALRRQILERRSTRRRYLMKEATGTAVDRMRQLEDEHRSLDERVRVLSRRAYLTPDEQREATELKRLKLSAKDQLHALGTRSNGT